MVKPSTDWRVLTEQAVANRVPKIITSGIRLDQESNRVIRKAAKKRGMSPAAYQRRASVAFALHDLGADERWSEVNRDEPGFTAFGTRMGQAPYRPAGHGFGAWIITGLRKAFPDD